MEDDERQPGASLDAAAEPGTGELRREIASLGWSVIKVERRQDSPPRAYSVGFFETFNHPEVIITGLDDLRTMHQIVNGIGFRVKEGERFEAGQDYPDIIVGYRCAFRPVHRAWVERLMPRAVAVNGTSDFPALQCFWPDSRGNFPWSADYDPKYRQAQPILSDDPAHTTGQ